MPERFKVVCIPCKRYTSAVLFVLFTHLRRFRLDNIEVGQSSPAGRMCNTSPMLNVHLLTFLWLTQESGICCWIISNTLKSVPPVSETVQKFPFLVLYIYLV